jgi:hypothetical protein
MACPVALLLGDLARAELYVRLLLDHSRRHGLVMWHAYGRCHQGLLGIKRGDVATRLGLVRTSLDEIGGPEFAFFLRLATLMDVRAEALACAGEIDGALDAFAETPQRVERAEELWIIPEFLRRKGELLIVRGASGEATVAEDHFRQALDSARQQGALSWELRAAVSLARLWYGQNRRAEALALLQPVYDRFTEGFDTTDLKAAKTLLDSLRRARAAWMAADRSRWSLNFNCAAMLSSDVDCGAIPLSARSPVRWINPEARNPEAAVALVRRQFVHPRCDRIRQQYGTGDTSDGEVGSYFFTGGQVDCDSGWKAS